MSWIRTLDPPLTVLEEEGLFDLFIAEFDDLPDYAVGVLVRAGYLTRSMLANASDRELLAVRGIGAATVAKVRAAIPPIPEASA